jgi:RND family efflux transporter MFP subunit
MATESMGSIGTSRVTPVMETPRLIRWYAFWLWQKYRRMRCFAWGMAVALAYLCLHSQGDSPAFAQQNPTRAETGAPRSVKVIRVAQVPMERAVTAFGSLVAYDQATVSVKVPGRLRSISVDLGSVVRQGQVIAQIETQDYQLRIQQATAALAQARARLGLAPDQNHDRIDPERTSTVRQARAVLDEAQANQERIKTLFDQGIIPQAQVGTAEASYKVALSRYEDAIEEVRNRQALLAQRSSELDLARQQLADTTIYAPFEGAIQERRASVGEYLGAGAPVATIVRMDPLRLRADVSERDAPSIRIGQHVRVTVEGDGNVYTGRIARLSPAITQQNRTLMVEAEVRNTGTLRPGSFARADIVIDDQNLALAVPANAISTFAGVEKVLLVQDGKVSEKTITTKRRAAEWVEVLSGVKVGDVVVINPGNLQSGQAVTVME